MRSFVRSTSRRSRLDRLLVICTYACAVVSAAIVLLVVIFLAASAWPALQRVGLARFVQDASWHPLSGRFRLLPMVVGTLLTTAGALLLAAPLGICSALFDRFYAPRWIAVGYRRLIELLAGIPSVVFGLWGLVVLVPLLASLGGSGQCLLGAILVLGLMILPTVAVTASAALGSIRPDYLTGAAALGLSRWSIARRIALPAARRGIAAGLLLATARALGETMAVVMLAGNVAELPTSLTSPVRTLTANIALEMGYATAEHRSILFVSGLLLMAVVAALVLLAELAGGRADG